jgi:hypothetical protein
MEPEIITDDSLPGDAHMTPSGEESAVSTKPADAGSAESPKPADALTLSEINAHLGKNFKDKDTALKALKDTFVYVGKKKEDIAKEISTEKSSAEETKKLANEVATLRKEMFYSKNPDHAANRALIEKLGGNPEEVVNMPEYKAVFEKVKGFDENQKLKTVLESNPRIAATRDSFAKAREALKTGNKAEAERLAVEAVMNANFK